MLNCSSGRERAALSPRARAAREAASARALARRSRDAIIADSSSAKRRFTQASVADEGRSGARVSLGRSRGLAVLVITSR